MNLLQQILLGLPQTLLAATLLFALFATLEKWTPCNPGQPFHKKQFLTDAAYYLVIPIFTKIIFIVYLRIGFFTLFGQQSDETVKALVMHGFGPLGTLPLWAQAAFTFILSDIILYWTHRLFHGKALWKFHAIHHSPTHVRWHSTYRFHPINIWLTFTLVNALMVLMGFSIESMVMLSTFNTLYSAMVHANLNWTFGPFKYVFASPVFHRWHHTSQEEGMDKNFAPTFPLLDIIFGTFYMPDNTLPEKYGIHDKDFPDSFIQQILWPFKR